MRIPRLLAVLALTAVACSDSVGPPAGLRVETSAQRFALGVPITYTVVNGSNETVRLYRCCDFITAVDQAAGYGWREVREPSGACILICAMGPYPVAPMTGVGGSTWVESTGTFRLRLGLAVGNDLVWDVTSNPFEVQPGGEILRAPAVPEPARD